jgi:hypothetical protein
MKAYYCFQSRLLSLLRFSVPLFLACFATVFAFARTPMAARDQVVFNGTVSGSGSVPTLPHAFLGFGALSNVFGAPPPTRAQPVVVKATQIKGAEGTGSCGGGYGFGVGLVDLDYGLGAGATTYDHGGFLWCETYAPYLCSEQNGGFTLGELE